MQAEGGVLANCVEVTRYYAFNGQRMAMRQANNEVFYLFGDQLGSVSLVADWHGDKISEERYTPLGRFTSADSIVPQPGNPQSLNRYSYAHNNQLANAVLHYGDSPDLQSDSLTLTDYELSGPNVEIIVNRDPTVLQARYAVGQSLMLAVTEEFYRFGVRKKGTHWEIGSSGQPYLDADW